MWVGLILQHARYTHRYICTIRDIMRKKGFLVGFLNMAKRKAPGMFFCAACDKQFEYRSKFSRHLESTTHQRFLESLAVNVTDNRCDCTVDDTPPSVNIEV